MCDGALNLFCAKIFVFVPLPSAPPCTSVERGKQNDAFAVISLFYTLLCQTVERQLFRYFCTSQVEDATAAAAAGRADVQTL